MSVEAVFGFVARNPPTAMIVGGILCLVLSALMGPFNPSGAATLGGAAPWLVGGGFVLQVLWLLL